MEGAFDNYHDQEQVWVVMLNTSNDPIARVMCTLGLVNSTIIHSREAFRAAIREGAVSVIFVHNHPSGNLSASPEDLSTTKHLFKAGKLLGIPVLDHMIMCDNMWTSIKERNPECFR